jgi:Ca2+-transporting ATPase
LAEVYWHAQNVKSVMKKLGTTDKGLSSEEAQRRLEKYGANELVEKEKVTALEVFLNQFKDIFVLMLLAATGISYFIGEVGDAAIIAAIIVLVAVVGFVQEYRAERAMEAMKKMTAPKAMILRDGKEEVIPAREIVPGDILLLSEGDRVAADARLFHVVDFKTDEAVLTGESTPVDKTLDALEKNVAVSDQRNMVFMATHSTYGRGRAVVTETGMKTEFGKIAEMVQATEEEETPLKRRLESFSKKFAILITVICAIIFGLEFIRGEDLIEGFLAAVALAISAVPEGLPAITTVTLALGARELARSNAVIRRLSSAETLGSTTVICSDKTGTLTRGEMTVRKIYVNGENYDVSGVGYEPKGGFYKGEKEIKVEDESELEFLLRIGTLCNNANITEDDEAWRVLGDPTEGALIVTASKAGMERDDLEINNTRIHEIPFSSERKRMTTIHETAEGEVHAYIKGAPEVVVDRCSHILLDGDITILLEEEKRKILEVNEEFARDALRVLGMAYKKLEKKTKFNEDVENDMVFVGLQGMIDPPRKEAKEANASCEKAGIKTVMITGDHRLTALAIAKEIGMFHKGKIALTGSELDDLGEEEFREKVEDTTVYARVSPEHKQRIVKALKERGHIVAMTGDGVNDAPAIKNADIGVAMGISGTDVTREASDMVLADDNFATIVNAVHKGRQIYDNIREYIRFLLACNFDEVLVLGLFAILNFPLPLLPAMLLWINLVTDGGPAIALSMDKPEEDLMERPPRDPEEGILSGMIPFIVASFIAQSFGTILIFCLEYFVICGGVPETLAKAQTMAFMQAAFFELFVIWNCRSETHSVWRSKFWNNPYLLVAVASSAILTVSLCYIPIFQSLFHTVPLDLNDWTLVLGTASLGLFILPELFMRKGRKHSEEKL